VLCVVLFILFSSMSLYSTIFVVRFWTFSERELIFPCVSSAFWVPFVIFQTFHFIILISL
jgi:hypothetical protein